MRKPATSRNYAVHAVYVLLLERFHNSGCIGRRPYSPTHGDLTAPKRGYEEAGGRTPCRYKTEAKVRVKRRGSNGWHEIVTSVNEAAT